MFTVAFLGWTMMCVIDYERGRCSEWRLAGLIPLFVIWTNLHGGVLGGTMTLGLAVLGWGAVFLASRASQGTGSGSETPAMTGTARLMSPIKDWRTAWLLAAIVVACLLTPFVNPHGMEMIRIWQKIVGSKVLPRVILEHMPMDPTRPLGIAIVSLGAFYIAVLAGALPRMRVSWLIPLVWFVLSFKGIRQGPLFAIVAAVAIADIWPHTLWHRLLVKHGDGSLARNDPPARNGLLWAAIPAIAVLLASTLQANRIAAPIIGRGWARLDPDFVPVDLNDPVAKYAASVPPGTPVFNDANLGGYLIYYAPTLKIFMDDRCELYGDAWLQHYVETLGLPPAELGQELERWRMKYHFDHALIQTSPPDKDKPAIERLPARPSRGLARGGPGQTGCPVRAGEVKRGTEIEQATLRGWILQF